MISNHSIDLMFSVGYSILTTPKGWSQGMSHIQKKHKDCSKFKGLKCIIRNYMYTTVDNWALTFLVSPKELFKQKCKQQHYLCN